MIIVKALKKTFDDLRDHHAWRVPLALFVIAVPFLFGITYFKEQALLDNGHQLESKQMDDESSIFLEKARAHDRAIETYTHHSKRYREIFDTWHLRDSLPPEGFKQDLQFNFAEIPEINRQIREAKQGLTGLVFYGPLANFLNTKVALLVAHLDLASAFLNEEEAEWNALSSNGLVGLFEFVRGSDSLHEHVLSLSAKVSEFKNQLDSAERLADMVDQQRSLVLQKYEEERSTKIMWAWIAGTSALYILVVLVCVVIKFIRELWKVTKIRRHRPAGRSRRGKGTSAKKPKKLAVEIKDQGTLGFDKSGE